MKTCASNSYLYIFSLYHFSTVFKPARSTTLKLAWKMKRCTFPQTTPIVWGEQIVTFRVETMHWDGEDYEYTEVTKYSTENGSIVTK